MLKVLNFALFHLFWIAAVGGAAAGWLWMGPLLVALVVIVHLKMVPAGRERMRELRFILWIGLAGTLADSLMHALGVTVYPTSVSRWPYPLVPPWITSMWVAFATMPRFSLAWLEGRPALATVFGAVGGPMSYFCGTRVGAVAVGESPLLTFGALSVEYAIFMPLMLHYRPRGPQQEGREGAVDRCAGVELASVPVHEPR